MFSHGDLKSVYGGHSPENLPVLFWLLCQLLNVPLAATTSERGRPARGGRLRAVRMTQSRRAPAARGMLGRVRGFRAQLETRRGESPLGAVRPRSGRVRG